MDLHFVFSNIRDIDAIYVSGNINFHCPFPSIICNTTQKKLLHCILNTNLFIMSIYKV